MRFRSQDSICSQCMIALLLSCTYTMTFVVYPVPACKSSCSFGFPSAFTYSNSSRPERWMLHLAIPCHICTRIRLQVAWEDSIPMLKFMSNPRNVRYHYFPLGCTLLDLDNGGPTFQRPNRWFARRTRRSLNI